MADITSAEKLRLLRALKSNSDKKKEETLKEFDDLKKREEQKKKEQEELEKQIEDLEEELNDTQKDIITEERFVKEVLRKKNAEEEKEVKVVKKKQPEDDNLEEIASHANMQGKENFGDDRADIYKIATRDTYDRLATVRNKLSGNEPLSYEENKWLDATKNKIEHFNINGADAPEEVLDNIVASKYLLRQIDKYKKPEHNYN